ncbi:MAG: hypothetical protein HY889_02495 [Deltaproteobacteria bacterium]|nr:hypothetical protein [Deltaproteobacteria bacterium]
MQVFNERSSPARDTPFELKIPAKENRLLRFSCIIVLLLLTSGGVAVISYLYHGKAGEDLPSTLLWLISWFAIDFYFFYVLVWNLAGTEIIRFDGESLTVRYDIEGCGRTKRLPASGISEISVERASGLNELFGVSGGTVKAVCEEEPHWFGIEISDEEALAIVRELKSRLKRQEAGSDHPCSIVQAQGQKR